MTKSNSRKHARKVTLDAAVNNAIEKAVDARKVAAFTVGAAGVLAGAAFAFGATPAMAAEAGAAAEPAKAPVAAGDKAGANKKDDSEVKVEAEEKASVDEKGKDAETGKSDKKDQTEANKEAGDKAENTNKQAEKKSENTVNTDGTEDKSTVVKSRGKRSLPDAQPTDEAATENQDRASNNDAKPSQIKPDTTDTTNTKIEINESNAETMPNVYGWGSSDNTYSVNGETHTVTFNFAKPKDGGAITNIAIFPAQNNGLNNDKSKRGAEYYSGDAKMHQSFSGNYTFKPNDDGSATLTMSDLFRDGNLNGGAEAYAANRSIFVYVTKDGTTTVYKTNAFRAATLVPPKTSGSVVLKYNQPLTDEAIHAALQAATNLPTERKDKKSVSDQLTAASTSKGVFTRENGKAVQVADTTDGKINVKSKDAYDKTTFDAINKETSARGAKDKTYVAGAKTLNTYMVTDLGFKSGAIPLTVARYDDRIDKPIVEDPTNVSEDVKTEIKKKLARLNHVSEDKITFDSAGNAVINFDGVDPKDAPKIALRDLVLKKLEEKDISVPAADKATVVYNPLGYSKAELERIKQSILAANKDNKDLGLTSTDQITLSYIEGDTVTAGHKNQGISNGMAENTITVKIKTDKAVAEFTSDIKQGKLTRLPDIRKDYNVSWDKGKNKLDGRDSDEGLSWSNDSHTTIIYRYDPTAAKELKTDDIIKLLKATPKDQQAGLRDLTGGEALDHEDTNGKPRKSHMKYALKDDEPTGELSLGNMSGAYWIGNQKVSHSDEKLGDNQSISGSYSWDPEAGSVTVAGKKDKIYKARLFVQPYAMTYYKDVYLEQGRNPGNTAKAINVIFVPQTNHKTSDLKGSIDEHATTQVDGKDVPTQPAYYNASADKKKAYDDALKVANDLYSQVKDKKESDLTEKQKADIDNATITLNKTRAELDGPDTNKDGLKTSIEADGKAQEGQNPASGTQATNQFKNVSDPDFKKADGSDDTERNNAAREAKKAYDKALEDAKTLNDDENATQKAVDDAKAKLDAAREKLNEFTTNKDELNNAIAQHGKVNTGDASKQGDEKLKTADPTYQNSTPAERDAYDKAVAEADRVSKEPNASQKEVNDAIKKLKEAKAKLDAKATDKSKLAAAEKQSFDNPDTADASKQSTFYKNAKDRAHGNDIAAKNAINNYDQALAKARDVLKDEKATQKEVDDAKDALTKAEDVLHNGYSTDANDLTKALADNVTGYLMPAYFNAFDQAQKDGATSQAAKDFKAYNEAYQKAKELKQKLDDAKTGGTAPTQNEIDEAKKSLEDARKVIDKYATDTKRLSAAVFNDIAIKASPAYQNLKALAEKTNPTPEEQAEVEAAKKAKEAYDKAAEKLHNAITNNLPKDKDKANGQDIPDSNIPKKDGDLNDSKYLDNIQAHKNGEPLNRDVDSILQEMNEAAKALDKFATKTDDLIKSINEDANTHPSPAFKNASLQSFQKPDGSGPDDTKNAAAKKAVDAYGEALNKAKEKLNDPNATQKDINDAKAALDKARTELDKYNTDVAKLEKSVAAHGTETVEGTKNSDAYRNASDPHFVDETGKPDEVKNQQAREAKTAYDKALTEAQALLAKHNDAKTPQDAKPTQVEIDAALEKLDEARKTLVGDDSALDKPGFGTNTTDLDVEIVKSSAADATTPTPGTVEDTTAYKNALAKTTEDGKENPDITRYKEALKKARELAEKQKSAKASERPLQKDVDEAYRALLDAKKIIADGYKTNATALQDEAALGAVDGNFTKSPEYKNAEAKKADDGTDNDELKAYKAALTEVTTMLNNFGKDGKPSAGVDDKDLPTQAQVDAALKKLSDARKAVEAKYATKTNKLENEVGDKDENDNPVIPPFEASVAYKNALEKAKTEENTTDPNSATTKLKAYADKLQAAQDLINKVKNPDPNAKPEDRPTQAQVDEALTNLKQAKKDIDDNFKTKVEKLQNEVDDKNDDGSARTPKFEESTEFANLKGKIKGDKKPDDLVAYEQALAKAKELIKKNTGKMTDPQDPTKEVDVPKDQLPTQKEVDEAQKALKEIKDKILANYKTSPVDLQKEVDLSKDGDDDKRDGLFENTPEFKNADAKKSEDGKDNADMAAYKKALDDAKKLLDKFDRTTGKPRTDLPAGEKAPTQKELYDALDALQAAKKKITDDYSTSKSDLRQEAGDDFTKSPEYQNAQAKGDDASKKALDTYKKALDDANKILGDKNATQAQVDEALKALQVAKTVLMNSYKTDKQALQQAFNQAIEDGFEDPTYQHLLEEIKRVLADPDATQAQVDEVYARLIGIGRTHRTGQQDHTSPDRTSNGTQGNHQSDFEHSQLQQGHSTLPDTTLHTVTKHMGEVTMSKRIQANTARTLRYKKLPQTGSGMSSVSGLGLLLLASAGLFLLPRKRETKD